MCFSLPFFVSPILSPSSSLCPTLVFVWSILHWAPKALFIGLNVGQGWRHRHVFNRPTPVTAACEQTGLIWYHQKRPYSRQMEKKKKRKKSGQYSTSLKSSSKQAAPILVHCGPAVLKFQQDESLKHDICRLVSVTNHSRNTWALFLQLGDV